MNRSEISEVVGDATFRQAQAGLMSALVAAVAPAQAAPNTPAQPRTPHVMPQQWHDRLRDMDDAARGRQAPRRTAETRPAPGVIGVPREMVREEAAKVAAREIQREQQSFAWREPVTVAEWLSGADGQYRSAFRQP